MIDLSPTPRKETSSFPREVTDVPITRVTGPTPLGTIFRWCLTIAIIICAFTLLRPLGLTNGVQIGIGIVVYLALGVGAWLLRKWVARRRVAKMLDVLLTACHAGDFDPFAKRVASKAGLFGHALFVTRLAMMLGLLGQFGRTIRIGTRVALRPIQPIDVPFEPRTLGDLANWHPPGAAPAAQYGLYDASGAPRVHSRQFLELLVFGRWSAVVFTGVLWLTYFLDIVRGHAPTVIFWLFSAWLAYTVYKAQHSKSVTFDESSWNQGFVVPGGLVFRGAVSKQDGSAQVHLFARERSVLIADQRRVGRWQVFVTDLRASADFEIAAPLLERVLGAWLSPLPPPAESSLTDLM